MNTLTARMFMLTPTPTHFTAMRFGLSANGLSVGCTPRTTYTPRIDMKYQAPTSPRPHDYMWNGYRVTHYRNHAGLWVSCPATRQNHYALRVAE